MAVGTRQLRYLPRRAWQTGRMDGHPEALIDLDAIQANVAALCRHVGASQVMAVVKSEGYGHGMVESARASLAGGASWLGVVHVADAIELRRAGFTVPVLSLLGSPDAPHADAIRHDVDLTVGTTALVDQIALAAEGAGKPARLHLEADTGMSRGGATADDWSGLVHAALAAQAAGLGAGGRPVVAFRLRRHSRSPLDRGAARCVP